MKAGNASAGNRGFELLSQGVEILLNHLSAPQRKECLTLLDRYIKEIELFNGAYGLVGAGSTEELIIKHILDSLAPAGIISRLLTELHITEEYGKTPRIADAGSGAGLPGIPLAIALPQCDFTLIERMGRRAGFLWNTKAALGLSNITVEEGELEKTENGCFNIITFRAFKPLDSKLTKTLSAACARGGAIAAYKGRREKIEQEIAPLKDCGDWEIVPYSVPFLNEEERHLLVLRLL